jgi:hypothetical protein
MARKPFIAQCDISATESNTLENMRIGERRMGQIARRDIAHAGFNRRLPRGRWHRSRACPRSAFKYTQVEQARPACAIAHPTRYQATRYGLTWAGLSPADRADFLAPSAIAPYVIRNRGHRPALPITRSWWPPMPKDAPWWQPRGRQCIVSSLPRPLGCATTPCDVEQEAVKENYRVL